MEPNVNGTFISEKTNKIRWRPEPFNNCHSFITASWDNEENSIKLWDFREHSEDLDVYPIDIACHKIKGDVTEAKFLNSDYCVISTSLGNVILLKISVNIRSAHEIEETIVWEKIHRFKNGDICPSTSLAVYDNDIATVGEDGRVNLLTAQRKDVVRFIEEADSCSLNCVNFLKHNEILTSNSRGQMKIWDLKSTDNTPSSTFMLSGDQIMPTCMVLHPTHRHILIVGDEEGSLTIWDLRNNMYPVNMLNAHAGSVSEIQIHPEYSEQLFSCSHAGDVWQWSGYSKGTGRSSLMMQQDVESDPWFMLGDGNTRDNLKVFALMPKLHKPVNTLDLNRDKVLCGCDNEAIYLITGNAFL